MLKNTMRRAAGKYGDEIGPGRERPPDIDASLEARFAEPVVD